jgi:ABC-type uncharacterized transport system substrate-binding protein
MRASQRARVASVALALGSPEYAEAGGLIAYGANLADGFREAAGYVGKILKGARPVICRSTRRPRSGWS